MSGRKLLHVLLTWLVLLTSWCDVTVAKCPWNEDGLLPWSSPSSWDDNEVPGFNAKVNITKRILLDTQPPDLTAITIHPGAALVWGNIHDIFLNISYIMVLGEFHMGSEDCRFKKRATINLHGYPDADYDPEKFGWKYIGVDSGGTLELHGMEKMSWTHLAHTIPASSDSDLGCGVIYDHQDSVLGQETRKGLHVMLWNEDGSVRDYAVFNEDTFQNLPELFEGVPDGVVVAAAVKHSVGILTETVFTTFESLGASLIRNVSEKISYSFIARIGTKKSAHEELSTQSYSRLLDASRDLEFRVASLTKEVSFQVIDAELTNPKITVEHDVSSWLVGDEILVTSTDFDWRQAEVKKMVECADCQPNQIRLDSPFKYMHYGEVTFNVDERAEVALLSRNILIQGQLEDTCVIRNSHDERICKFFKRDMYGGHVKVGHAAVAHVEGVELYHMGQQLMGTYPLHFHMMNDARGMWFRNNSIHHSLSRCVTIHASFYVEVSDNVCYLHHGHGYFIEDAVEQNVTLDRNLGVGTMFGSLIMSDENPDWCGRLEKYCGDLATFWITHPNNIITRNVAAGSDVNGYHILFANAPLGISKLVPWVLEKTPNNSLQYFPMKEFSGNVAHSNFKSGIFFDSRISNGEKDGTLFVPENGVLPVTPVYDPRDPPNENGTRVWTKMERLTMYKNRVQNLWIKGGNIEITQSSLADSQKGFTGGTIGFTSGTEVKDSVFVGQTDNWGEPQKFVDRSRVGNPTKMFNHSYGRNPYDSWTAVSIYQGPMIVENCHFSRYGHYWWADEWEDKYGFRPVQPGGALSFKRDNIYPTTPWSYVKGLKFGYCDDVHDGNWVFRGNLSTYGWGMRDGNKAFTFRDLDGSVTGTANTQVVLPHPFYTGPECVYRSNWHMSVCPYKYVQMEIVGNDGVLSKSKRSSSPIVLRRDDVAEDSLHIEGTQKNTFLLRTQKSYTVNFNKDLGKVPKFLDIRGYNIEKDDVVRIGICLPKDTTQFEIKSSYPSITVKDPHTMASSLTELDNDVTGRMFFWDKQAGLLYFKLMSNETRQNKTEQCANDLCPRYKITRLDGGEGPADCSNYDNPPIADTSPTPAIPQPKVCTGPDSAQGLGAVPENVVTADPFNISCPALEPVEGRITPGYRGCYRNKQAYSDVPYFETALTKAMTRQWCQDRCYYRGYVYAAVSHGKRCTCGDVFGLYEVLDDAKCNYPCRGDANTTCGGQAKIQVFTTGLAPKPVPARCGPDNLGDVFEDQCLYLRQQEVSVGRAQRMCARLGGNLVAIDSQLKQTAVEYYLREKQSKGKIWTGLNHVQDSSVWEQRDGRKLGSFSFWKGTAGTDATKHFVYVSGDDGYKWLQTKDTDSAVAAPLCDLPLTPLPAMECCGVNDAGRRLGSNGTCYMLIHDPLSQEQANYACHVAGGKMVTYEDRDTEYQLAQELYRMGAEQGYWTDKVNRVMKWSNSMYISEKVLKTDKAGALCVLDTLNSTHRCPVGVECILWSDWTLSQDSCYLSLGTVVKSYGDGAALCEMEYGSSHVVRVESEAENSFLTSLISSGALDASHILLGLFYSSRHDDYIWAHGERPAFTAWATGHGTHHLVNGSCAVLDASGVWVNAYCDSMNANVVCEMPALVV